jgi:hypothetical protein
LITVDDTGCSITRSDGWNCAISSVSGRCFRQTQWNAKTRHVCCAEIGTNGRGCTADQHGAEATFDCNINTTIAQSCCCRASNAGISGAADVLLQFEVSLQTAAQVFSTFKCDIAGLTTDLQARLCTVVCGIANEQGEAATDGDCGLSRSCSNGGQSSQGTPVESIKNCAELACLPLDDLKKPAKTVVFGGLYKKKPGLNELIIFIKNTFVLF